MMGGRACLRGLRITVSLVVNLVANGMSTSEILEEYPDLEGEDVKQALAYAAALANDEFHPFAPTTPKIRVSLVLLVKPFTHAADFHTITRAQASTVEVRWFE